MWRSVLCRLWKSTDGAVAPTIALSLVGLIAAGGIAFDYARLAAMDTELQDAADQAALAAATQLDRSANAITHATAAIQDATASKRLAANLTRFANDGTGGGVAIDSITFCSAFDDSKADTGEACVETTTPAEARFVWVKTSLRTADYAFTPIAGALSGTSHAEGVAGVDSSICNIAPLFVCVGSDTFPTDADIGKGLLMKTGSKNSWFPGNYGYLDFGPGNPGVIDALLGHGLNGCQKIDESNTQPGNKDATDAINTRFDVYAGSGATNSPSICTDLADGTGCPDQDVGKDLTMTMTKVIVQSDSILTPPANTGTCGDAATAKNATPVEISYTPFVLNSSAKGMPRDACHYSGTCTGGNFGDGSWNRDAYFLGNYGWDHATWIANTGLSATVSRYNVYKWELAHRNDTPSSLAPKQIGGVTSPSPNPKHTGHINTYTYSRVCAFRKPVNAKGPADQGRRILPVVAASCASLNGAADLDEFHAIRVFNVFLPEPSMNRTTAAGFPGVTDDKEIYGEVIGSAVTPGGGTGFQYYSRNRPYLVR
jgi:Flp pilus assembly protein TadG